MATTELSKSKSICILAVVVGCFAILWPKIFLPMFQSALSLTSSQSEDQIKTDYSSSMLPPKVREAMKLSRPQEFKRLPGRPFQGEKVIANQQTNKTGGVMGFFMPIYTIGIIIFFLYTIFKMVFKKNYEEEKTSDDETPKVPDFNMDPEYRKFILSDEYDQNGVRIKNIGTNFKRKPYFKAESEKKIIKDFQKTEKVVEEYGKEKVSKALHTLIRDMEQFKAKLIEVEECRTKIAQIESAKVAAKQCLNENKEKLSAENEESNDSNEELSEKEDENFDNEEEDVCHQNIDDIDLERAKLIDNEICEERENLNFEDLCDKNLTQKLLHNLDSDVWNSIQKEMQQLQHFKEE